MSFNRPQPATAAMLKKHGDWLDQPGVREVLHLLMEDPSDAPAIAQRIREARGVTESGRKSA